MAILKSTRHLEPRRLFICYAHIVIVITLQVLLLCYIVSIDV